MDSRKLILYKLVRVRNIDWRKENTRKDETKRSTFWGAIFVKDLRRHTVKNLRIGGTLCPEFQRWRCSRNRKIEQRARSKISNLRRSMEHDAPLSPNKASKSVPYETTPWCTGKNRSHPDQYTEQRILSSDAYTFWKERQCKLRLTITDFSVSL